jgi:hypothetical protein
MAHITRAAGVASVARRSGVRQCESLAIRPIGGNATREGIPFGY